jgi:hypothetical protein
LAVGAGGFLDGDELACLFVKDSFENFVHAVAPPITTLNWIFVLSNHKN